MESILEAKRVHEVFEDCLFRDDEDPSDHVRADGILTNVGFHPKRLEGYREEITVMLNELPEAFHQKIGGGMSFLNACMDKHGNHWAEHPTMEQLFLLGIGIGRVVCILPREVWHVLPGGMPYFAITPENVDEGEK